MNLCWPDSLWYICGTRAEGWVNMTSWDSLFICLLSVCLPLCLSQQSGRSPKVVALFSATNFSSYIIELLQLQDAIQIQWNYALIHYNIAKRSHLMIKKICQISCLLPDLVAFSCYTVNIHLEKLLMRYDTKRAIWWDYYNRHMSIFYTKHMSTIFRTLQVNKWWSKNQTFFSFCEINATELGNKKWFHLDCIMQLK